MDTSQQRNNLKHFECTDDGDIKTLLGVEIEKSANVFRLYQKHLISRMLTASTLEEQQIGGRNTRDTPAVKPLLIKCRNEAPRTLPWKHRSIIGMIN